MIKMLLIGLSAAGWAMIAAMFTDDIGWHLFWASAGALSMLGYINDF